MTTAKRCEARINQTPILIRGRGNHVSSKPDVQTYIRTDISSYRVASLLKGKWIWIQTDIEENPCFLRSIIYMKINLIIEFKVNTTLSRAWNYCCLFCFVCACVCLFVCVVCVWVLCCWFAWMCCWCFVWKVFSQNLYWKKISGMWIRFDRMDPPYFIPLDPDLYLECGSGSTDPNECGSGSTSLVKTMENNDEQILDTASSYNPINKIIKDPEILRLTNERICI